MKATHSDDRRLAGRGIARVQSINTLAALRLETHVRHPLTKMGKRTGVKPPAPAQRVDSRMINETMSAPSHDRFPRAQDWVIRR